MSFRRNFRILKLAIRYTQWLSEGLAWQCSIGNCVFLNVAYRHAYQEREWDHGARAWTEEAAVAGAVVTQLVAQECVYVEYTAVEAGAPCLWAERFSHASEELVAG